MSALFLSILCMLVAVAGSLAVARGALSTSTKAAISIITVIAVLGAAYSLVQLMLAVIGTAGERRWFARQVSERRQGERARKPRGS